MDGLISTEDLQQPQLVPPAKPLHMPIQSLTDGALSNTQIESTPRVWVTRALLFTATLGLTAYGTRGMYEVVGQSTATAVQIVLVILFALTFFWIALSAVTSLMGFIVLLIARPGQSAGYIHPQGRTAIVWPLYNEDTRLVFASLRS